MRSATLNMLAALALLALPAFAADQNWYVRSDVTNAALATSANASGFVGYLDEVSCYIPTGPTCTVVIVAVDSIGTRELVLATNAATVGFNVWRPRLANTPDVTGDTALVVTNNGDRLLVSGETIKATVVSSASNQLVRFRLKYEK